MEPRQIRRATGARVLCLLLVLVWSAGCHCTAKRQCKFDSMVDNSALQMCFLGICMYPFTISGEVNVRCTSKLLTDHRKCSCSLENMSPVFIAGIGTMCIEPLGPCAKGKLDCDGGSALSVDAVTHAQLGACTGNSNCASQCAAHCSGLGKGVYDSGCESFCQSGPRADLACICDQAGAATCSGGVAGVNDCPDGGCEGKDNELDNDCHCTCIDKAAGAPSAAGTLACEIGLGVRIEGDPICDGSQVLVRFREPPCAPFTSSTSTNIVLKSNEDIWDQGPYSETGSNGTCDAFDQDVMTGYELVSVLAFLDTTIGDVMFRFTADCQ
jgi:hypothetical protein